MRAILLVLFTLLPSISLAADVSIGGVSLAIPNPRGFSPVTQDMHKLYEWQKLFITPTAVEYASFISDEEVPTALNNGIPVLSRRFSVQTVKSLVQTSVSLSDFAKMKDMIKSQNNEIWKKAEKEMPGVSKQIIERLKNQYDKDVAFSVSQMLPLPVHDETDRKISFSSFVKCNVNEAGNPLEYVVACTITLTLVKGKVLFLYSYADESELEWSKEASKQWADAVVASNPSDLQTAAVERLPPSKSGIDWGQVIGKTVAGVFIALAFGLVNLVRKRGMANKEQ